MEPNVDLLYNGQAQGAMANYIQANGGMNTGKSRPYINPQTGKAYVTVYLGGDPKSISSYSQIEVNEGTLRREEWIQLDKAVLTAAQNRLTGIQDLRANGLIYSLGNAMATTVLEWHTSGEHGEAIVSMDGIGRGQNDAPTYDTKYLPIPILHSDYQISERVLAASRLMGNPIDTTDAENASRNVAEKLEKMLFTDILYKFGGGAIYSYVNFPHRGEMTLTMGWDESGKTGKMIVDEVLAMKQMSMDAKHYGPWMIYIPSAYETKLDEDYSDSKGEKTIRDRIMAIANIKGIKVVDFLAADTVLLVQMTSDVVRLVDGLPIQNIQWKSEGNLVNNYKVMTIQVPQIRADQNNRTGIVHLA